MSFDITRCDQSEWIDTTVKKDLFKSLLLSEKTDFTRASCLFIGLADGLLTVTKRVSLVAENYFKGLLNIAGASVNFLGFQGTKNCSLKKGCIQILQTAKHGVILPFTVVSAGYHLVNTTIKIAMHPKRFAAQQLSKYDPGLKDRIIKFRQDYQPFEQRLYYKLVDIVSDSYYVTDKQRSDAIDFINRAIEYKKIGFEHPLSISFDEYFKGYIQHLKLTGGNLDWEEINKHIPAIRTALS